MKSNRIVPTIAGALLFLSILLTFVWFLPASNLNQSEELSLKDTILKIEGREVKEINFKETQVEITDKDGKKFFTKPGSDPAREMLLDTIQKYNNANTKSPIKYSEEPASSGWGWIVLINTAPFFIMWLITLAVIVYAVRTLSRNKG